MIAGEVDASLDARIPLSVVSIDGTLHGIETVVDTGFNGFLTLPPNVLNNIDAERIEHGRAVLADGELQVFPIYEVTVLWDGKPLTIETEAADIEPLVGMALMDGYKLEIAVRAFGMVTLTRMKTER